MFFAVANRNADILRTFYVFLTSRTFFTIFRFSTQKCVFVARILFYGSIVLRQLIYFPVFFHMNHFNTKDLLISYFRKKHVDFG